jgi:polyhydroxyalkanoate synthesis regulator phasin
MRYIYFCLTIILITFLSSHAQNVGIGEASPATKLDIKGNAGSDLLNIRNSSGTSRMYVQEDGNVGIGTTTPDAKLNVYSVAKVQDTDNFIEIGSVPYYGSTGTATGDAIHGDPNIHLNSEGKISFNINADGGTSNDFHWHTGNEGSTSELMRLTQNGNLGVGTTSPNDKLQVSGGLVQLGEKGDNSKFTIPNTCSGNYGTNFTTGIYALEPGSGCGDDWYIASYLRSGTEKRTLEIAMQNDDDDHINLKTDGPVGIKNASPSKNYSLDVNGRINSSGITETSDKRLKENITNINEALQTVNQLKGVYYDWKQKEYPERNLEGGRQVGVVAQQIEKHLPEVVDTDNEGYKSVEYSHMVPVLIEAVKEQTEIIEEKEKQIEQLKEDQQAYRQQTQKQIEALAERVDELEEDRSSASASR